MVTAAEKKRIIEARKAADRKAANRIMGGKPNGTKPKKRK